MTPKKIYFCKSLSSINYKNVDFINNRATFDKLYDDDIVYILESEHNRIVDELKESEKIKLLKLDALKRKMDEIKQSAEDKMYNNNDRQLSESYIEACACIDVIDELYKILLK
jgi:ribonucleotide reductase alpha subunit